MFISYDPDHVNPIIPTDLIKIAGDEMISQICLARNMSKEEFFEYYEDDLVELYTTSKASLLEFNFDNQIYLIFCHLKTI